MAKKKITPLKKIIIKDNSIFNRNEEDFLITEIDGEAVMMNTLNGSYWGLNSTTTDIWSLLEKPQTFQNIIEYLLKNYDVEEEICREQTISTLVKLLQTRILQIDEASQTIT